MYVCPGILLLFRTTVHGSETLFLVHVKSKNILHHQPFINLTIYYHNNLGKLLHSNPGYYTVPRFDLSD